MGFFHHGTIRKYTAALLDIFNNIEIQYAKSNNEIVSKNIPIKYSSREKSRIFDEVTTKQLLDGNYNVLPRASLSLVTIIKAEQRTTNKNVKVNSYATESTFDYMYNSVPYEFTFQLDVQCRGMNEVSMIIEQIAPKFNPFLNVDIWDASNLNEPTRVPIKLLDISVENEEYEELSSNIFNIGFGITVVGNLYPPIKSVDRIKEFKMTINESDGQFYDKKVLLGWDVDIDGKPNNEKVINFDEVKEVAPVIIDMTAESMIIGDNNLTVIKDYPYSDIVTLTYDWNVISGDATIVGTNDTAILTINSEDMIEVQVTITDEFGNYSSLNKTFVTAGYIVNYPEPIIDITATYIPNNVTDVNATYVETFGGMFAT